ncbi:MAG: sigma 54-interacting transcriptional regulator, partial [Deferrisomatales bacterium]|nr:sigma 54-interacting transcriptional regulator [Deferrisomatales bacterium]
AERRRGRYRVGEGVMGRVLETGQPMVIPSIGAEPLFLDRTGARADLDRSRVAFLCVPVKVGTRTVGVLSADRLSAGEQDLEEDLRLLSIVAGVVAQAVRVQQMVRREKAELADENRRLRRALDGAYRLDNMVGTSPLMLAVYEQVHLVAKSRATVLITGESGTGKELVAKAIHFNSDRAQKPYVRLSCASLPPTLLESELFGHERGAFTGAVARKPGRFELADGGTIFLDEVGEIPLELQVKLLRVLQERELERLGGRETLRVDVRVVAATNRELAREVREGRFREDLYYRLNVVPLHLPPLRERREDVPLLAHHFLRRFSEENRKPFEGISPEALELLVRHDWPGNVRELENTVERAVVLARGPLILPQDLPGFLAESAPARGEGPRLEDAVARVAADLFEEPPPEGVYRAVVGRVERVLLDHALARSGGVRLQAARLLGINRNTLYAKLERPDEP